MRRLAHLFGFWLWIGFAGGAAVLLLIATPLESRLRAAGTAQGDMNVLLSAVAAVWVIVSGCLAWAAALRLAGRAAAAAHALGALLCVGVFFAFLQAGAGAFAAFRGGREAVGERFVFGPYPDEEAAKKLASEGFTGIVSLLSPVVPFEAILLDRERASASAAGLELVEAQMLPWVSSNEAALAAIRRIAKEGRGRWYVHCYLGRHRVDLARFAIQEAAGVAAERPRVVLPEALERGAIFRHSDTIALGPLPTKDEWFEFVVRSGTRRVVCLLDPANREDAPWIEQERAWATASGIDLVVLPARRRADAASAAAAARAGGVRTYVHSFMDDDRLRRVREAL